MASEYLHKVGTQVRFFVTGSFSPADSGSDYTIGTPSPDVALTLAGVLDGEGRQSAKVDLGEKRPAAYEVLGCVDFTGETPDAVGRVDYYWAPSTNATQANGNVAANSGADADAPDGALGSITLAEFLLQCQFIGTLSTHDGGSVQCGLVSERFEPSSRYGQLIVVNESGVAFEGDDVEAHQVFNPIVGENQ